MVQQRHTESNEMSYPEDCYGPKKMQNDANVIREFEPSNKDYEQFDGYIPPPPPPPLTIHRTHNEMSSNVNTSSYQSPERMRYTKHLMPQNLPLVRNTSKTSVETDI